VLTALTGSVVLPDCFRRSGESSGAEAFPVSRVAHAERICSSCTIINALSELCKSNVFSNTTLSIRSRCTPDIALQHSYNFLRSTKHLRLSGVAFLHPLLSASYAYLVLAMLVVKSASYACLAPAMLVVKACLALAMLVVKSALAMLVVKAGRNCPGVVCTGASTHPSSRARGRC